MSFEITTAFVQQYKDNVIHLSQQKGSRLRGTVRIAVDVNGKTYFFERVGATTAQKKQSRHADTPLISTPHSRRMVTLADYEWADLVDKADKVRLLITPESEYAIAGVNAMGRAMDDEIILAANGNAYAGENGATVVVLPSAQKIAASGAGMNITKILQTKEIMDLSDVDPDEPRFMVVSPKQITSLLNTTEVKSSDYNTVKALAEGKIDTFAGFKFVTSNRLQKSGSDRLCLAYAAQGMGLAIGADVITRITERADKSYSVQVFLAMTIGATRIEDEKVIEIACQE